MEDKIMNTEALSHPDGVEVKLSTKSTNIIAFTWAIVLFIIGTFLFVYIWGDFTAYKVGNQMGSSIGRHGLLPFMIPYFLTYILIQAITLYFLSGRKFKSLGWHFDWGGAGIHLKEPIALKYYRVVLLLPGILLGLLPAFHGFCSGDAGIFYLGVYGTVCTSPDAAFWYKLRNFDDEDLLLAGNKSYKATIIKRNYGRNMKKSF